MTSCEIIEGVTLHQGDCRDIMREMPCGYLLAFGAPRAYHRLAAGIEDAHSATYMSSHLLASAGEPITDEARAWAGWGTGLKPLWAPIVVARRPLEGSLIDTVYMNGLYPPNLMVSEAALAAAREQGAPHRGGGCSM